MHTPNKISINQSHVGCVYVFESGSSSCHCYVFLRPTLVYDLALIEYHDWYFLTTFEKGNWNKTDRAIYCVFFSTCDKIPCYSFSLLIYRATHTVTMTAVIVRWVEIRGCNPVELYMKINVPHLR